MRTFLSYARADAQTHAQGLRDQLSDARRVTWLDRHDIPAGHDWWDRARQAIVDANAFVLLITPDAMTSDPVRREYELALTLHKHFIPILVLPTAVPANLKNRNYRDLTANYADGLARLIGDLEEAWEEVAKDLANLTYDDGGGAWTPLPGAFSGVVERLEGAAKARTVRPPEVFQAFTNLLRKVRDDVAGGRALQDLVGEVQSAAYPDRTWAYDAVREAHRPFFQQLLAPVQTALSAAGSGEVVPVVLLVMTDQEAAELNAGTAFASAGDPLQGQFTKMQALLAALNIPDWRDRYHPRTEQWQPFGALPAAPTIGDLIRKELASIRDASKPLVPRFVDVRGIDSQDRRSELRSLRYGGCVVVMDLISMCHPRLHESFLNSRLDCQERVFLVQVSPLGVFPALDELTLSFKKRIDLEFWDRYSRDRDANCRQIANEVDLERFLSLEMINVLPPEKRPKTGVRGHFGQ